MTILEGSTILFEWFAEHDSFSVDKDLSKLLPKLEAEEKDERTACLTSALEEFEASGIARSCVVNDIRYWTLKQNLNGYDQTIQINAETASSMATIINGFCTMMNVDGEKCDPKAIGPKDISNLITVCATMVGEKNNDITDEGIDFNELNA